MPVLVSDNDALRNMRIILVYIYLLNTESPSNFSHTVVEDDQHSVRFTWSPPPEQEQSGEITHYTISCASGNGDEIVANQAGLEATISAFSPATHYWCSISASTTCHGEGPHSDDMHLLTSEIALNDSIMIMYFKMTVSDAHFFYNTLF